MSVVLFKRICSPWRGQYTHIIMRHHLPLCMCLLCFFGLAVSSPGPLDLGPVDARAPLKGTLDFGDDAVETDLDAAADEMDALDSPWVDSTPPSAMLGMDVGSFQPGAGPEALEFLPVGSSP